MKISTSLFLIISLSYMSQIIAQGNFKATKKDTILTNLGHQRTDSYFWMNKRDSKEVLDYISQENEHTKEYFSPLNKLQNILLDEFEGRINPNDVSAPFFINKRQFQAKSIEKKDYQEILLIENGKESLFFDENQRAIGKSYYDLGDWAPSSNNKILAFSEDYIGRRKYTIYFRDEKTKKDLKDNIKNTDGSIIWANDNKTVFYVKKDEQTLREFKVFSHEIGSDSKSDKLIFEEKDERFSVSISKTISDNFIIINTESSSTNEQLLINANNVELNYKVFLARKNGHLYSVQDNEKGFYVLSNENAENNKLILYAGFPAEIKSGFTEIITHDKNILIEGVLILKNYIVIQKRINGLQEIESINLQSNKSSKIAIDEETFNLDLGFNDDYEPKEIFYSYTSMTNPATIFTYQLENKLSTVFFQKNLIDLDFKTENYESKRLWATANDGTKIPISLVYKKGIDLSKAPLLLYGYGSYGVTIPVSFSATRISLLDRGFVYAIAHIRGGKYLGEEWYNNGKFLKKKNTFTDFINAAEYLSMKSYCDKNKIYAQGGSAGGLLMGAITNLAPYLWKGIIAQVPFVDVVTTILDETIPLTVGEYEEWGNPNQEEFYYYMLNYSPYDNVKKMDYPAMFITTGYHDSQVQYWEPLKWIAKIREYRTNDNPLLFDCNMDAGHGGGSGRSSERIELAKMYSFILGMEGIDK